MKRKELAVVLACLALGACGGEPYSDLRQFVKDSDGRPRGRIPPLPDVKEYKPFPYEAEKDNLLDPFKPRKIQPQKTVEDKMAAHRNRPREPLEAYPLENLRMVGTLQQKKEVFALVKTPDNNLFRVKVGNYLGQNFGRIIEITESSIKLVELVLDSTSAEETERTATLQLAEEQEVAKK